MTAAAPELASVETTQVPKGKVVFRQGDKADAAYLVESGSVGIFREVDGRRVPIATIGPGDLFGEMAVIDGSPRSATAYVIEDATLKVIAVKTMIETMRAADPFIRTLIHMLMNNLRTVHDTHTPRTRNLADSVVALGRCGEALANFLQSGIEPELKAALAPKLKDYDAALSELRQITTAYRDRDRRAGAVPQEQQLPPA
jgi:CRP-like cAMP-binding protein